VRPGTLLALGLALLAAACGTSPPRSTPDPGPYQARTRAEESPVTTVTTPRGGAYYKDDGPGGSPPANLEAVADAVPRREALHRFANRPYEVFGRSYLPMVRAEPFSQRGMASWYGRRYHGSNTSSGEPYDMYAMSAAHPTLPIPSYARVTNLANGKSVVVRINDRGPFHSGRTIDLSYTAAWKLGYAEAGSALVQVESIVPEGTQAAAAPAQGREETLKPPAPVEMKGIFLQLGAFAAQANAETFRSRIARDLAWLSEAIQVRMVDGLFKLHLGPYRSQDDARRIADRIRADLDVAPVLLLR
jgi:rare lipoprotein A